MLGRQKELLVPGDRPKWQEQWALLENPLAEQAQVAAPSSH